MKINICFDSDIYEIEFFEFLGKNGESYKDDFCNWYYEKSTETDEQGYSFTLYKQKSKHSYKVFDINVFIDWLLCSSPNCNPRIIAHYQDFELCDKNLPIICF